jgi:hypothetical protein
MANFLAFDYLSGVETLNYLFCTGRQNAAVEQQAQLNVNHINYVDHYYNHHSSDNLPAKMPYFPLRTRCNLYLNVNTNTSMFILQPAFFTTDGKFLNG